MGLILPDADDVSAYAPPPEPGILLPQDADSHAILETVARGGFHAVDMPSAKGCLADPERLVGLSMKRLRESLRGSGLALGSLADTVELGSRSRNERTEARRRIASLVEAANRLECPLITVHCVELALDAEPNSSAAGDAARYALDTLYDVEQELAHSGVKLALGGAGRSILADADARRILEREKPQDVGFALADALHLAPGALRGLAKNTFAAQVGLVRPAMQALRLDDEDAARELVASLGEGGYAGRLSARATGVDFDAETLTRIHDTLVRLSL